MAAEHEIRKQIRAWNLKLEYLFEPKETKKIQDILFDLWQQLLAARKENKGIGFAEPPAWNGR